jgi:nitronate monooxygenase
VLTTWLTDRFDLQVPVIGAPMAGPGEGSLAAAVSRAGGLGMIGVSGARDPEWIRGQGELAAADGKPFGFGLMGWVLASRPEQLDAALACRPALVSVSFGRTGEGDGYDDVARLLAAVREAGVAVTTQVGTLAEAQRAAAAGVDLLVARGGEGGGHGRDEVATLPLLQEVLDRVPVPIVAAGGIAGPRGLAAVLAAGAEGAWVGTALLGCTEAGGSAAAKRALFAGRDTSTAYGRVFDVAQRLDWPPEFGGRALRNRFFDTWSERLDELAGDDEAAAQLARARADQDLETAYVYAGQGVGLLAEERSAADVLADFATAEKLLRRFAPPR